MRCWKQGSILKALALCILLASSASHSDIDSDSAKRFQLTVESQTVEQALRSLANASGRQLLFPYDQIEALKVISMSGRYTLEEALSIILKGTSLSGELTTEGVILVTPIQKKSDRGSEMNSRKKILAATVAFFAGAGSATGVFGQDGEAASAQSRIDEIVVTAQKRGEQSLQDVPVSISVLDGDALDSGSLNVLDALKQVPGVSMFSGFQGGGVKVAVRGVAASGPLFNGASTVGYYLDEVPFGLVTSAISPDANAYDLDRVEVLRGPQGTLYGASALNGVVRILTKNPNMDEFDFKARTSMSSTDGGGENYRGDLAVNVSLITGKLAARLVVSQNNMSGWVDQPNAIDGNIEDVNDADEQSIRLKIMAQPTDNLSLVLSGWRSRSDYGAPSISDDDGINPLFLSLESSSDYDILGLSVDYDFAGFSVHSATSHIDFTNNGLLDLLIPNVTNPLGFATNLDAEVFTQEIGLYSTGEGDWQWSLGGFYRDAEDHLAQAVPPLVFPNYGTGVSKSESFAIFGEVTRSFLDKKLDLTIGLRYFEDDVLIGEDFVRGTGSTVDAISDSSTFDTVTPRVVLTWYPHDELTIYSSYSEGFRSGYDQGTVVQRQYPDFAPVEEDSLRNYEVGAKGSLLGGRLAFNSALYYIDWQDVQQTLLVPVTDDGTTGEVTAAVNATSASGVGIDLGLTLQPSEGLQLGLNFSWNDLSIDENLNLANGEVLFEKGDRLNDSVEYTVGLTGDYSFPLGDDGLEAQLSASANYHTAQDVRNVASGTVFIFDGDDILTSRLSLTVISPDHWEVMLYGDNLGNEDGTVRPSQSPGRPFFNNRLRPRTVGLQVEYQY